MQLLSAIHLHGGVGKQCNRDPDAEADDRILHDTGDIEIVFQDVVDLT